MIQIGNREIEALFDTGAARSLLHEKVYRSLPSNMQLASAETTVALFDVQNKQLSNLGKVTLNVKYGDKLLEQEFIVTNGITEMCIFGIDAIFKHEFMHDYAVRQKRSLLQDKKRKNHPLVMEIGKCRRWKWKGFLLSLLVSLKPG